MSSLRAFASSTTAALVLISLVALFAAVWHWQAVRRIDLVLDRSDRLRVALELSALLPAKGRDGDFTQHLTRSPQMSQVVSQLQRSSAQVGVAFMSVSVADRAPSAQRFGRSELSVVLRGSYPNLKIVLAEALDRYPQTIIQRMTLRRLSNVDDTEARVELVQVTRPLPAAIVLNR